MATRRFFVALCPFVGCLCVSVVIRIAGKSWRQPPKFGLKLVLQRAIALPSSIMVSASALAGPFYSELFVGLLFDLHDALAIGIIFHLLVLDVVGCCFAGLSKDKTDLCSLVFGFLAS